MQERGLKLNADKSIVAPVSGGVDFLGYHFDGNGKSVPLKAEINLQERLESMFLTSTGFSVKEKLKKGTEILEGWEQYFREERSICSIQEYAVVLYMVQNKEEALQKISDIRPNYKNIYRELAEYMLTIWKKQQRIDLQLLEYEQLYGLDEVDKGRIYDYRSPFVRELLRSFEKLLVYEEGDTLIELVQNYTELQCLGKAARMMEHYQKIQTTERNLIIPEGQISRETVKMDSWTRRLFYELFVGREDTYSEEFMTRRKMVEQKNEPLTEDVLEEHLSGRRTIGTYVQRPNSTAKYLVIDLDISKKILLEYTTDSPEFGQYIKICGEMTGEIIKILNRLGLRGYIENSGYRGYHIWIFFTEWIPVRFVNALSQIIMENFYQIQKEEISIEFFPDDRRMRAGKTGQSIRIPLGMNPRSGQVSCFLDENFERVTELSSYLKGIAKFSLTAVKRIIGMHVGKKGEYDFGSERPNALDRNLKEFGKMDIEIQTVLEKCSLMCYLCQKARKTGYLSHGERLSILYVFGHMGDAGNEFVHQIMSYTLNYQYSTTERFINKRPQKPVSCIKLREQYQQVTAEIGCSCNFRRTKNCYPSPVLHALKSADTVDGQITIPSSRSLSREKEQTVYQEINVYRKVQELAGKVLEMKRQKRGIDKNIAKVEREMENIYDNLCVDCLEIEMGLLCRRKKEGGGYEWLIEI